MQDLQEIRHYLHQNPECSGKELETAKYISSTLRKLGVTEIHSGFSQQSIVAEIKGSQKGKNILFRCELDALPIDEKNTFEYASSKEGVSHKCGHDGHMTILLGLAEKLVNNPPERGNVILLFQSAEETGQGAQAVCDSSKLKEFTIDYAFALHNVPGFKKNTIVIREGVFTPTVESFRVELIGETSHAGEPDKGVNPARFVAQFIEFMSELHQPEIAKDNYFVVAPIFIEMGEPSYGISAGKASMGYTIRSTSVAFFNAQKKVVEDYLEHLSMEKGLELKINWLEAFHSNMNHPEAVEVVLQAAENLNLASIIKDEPFDWGEDFGLITQQYTGAMFGWGAGEEAYPLHDSRYDFPDDIINNGVQLFYEIAKQIQK